jgi:hypothetical protein
LFNFELNVKKIFSISNVKIKDAKVKEEKQEEGALNMDVVNVSSDDENEKENNKKTPSISATPSSSAKKKRKAEEGTSSLELELLQQIVGMEDKKKEKKIISPLGRK